MQLFIAVTASVGEVGVSRGCMNALPCAGWVLWDTAVLREFCLQPSRPMRWAFQAWNRGQSSSVSWLLSQVLSPSGQPWLTVGSVTAPTAALPPINTAAFHRIYAASSSGRQSVRFFYFFFLKGVCEMRSCTLRMRIFKKDLRFSLV